MVPTDGLASIERLMAALAKERIAAAGGALPDSDAEVGALAAELERLATLLRPHVGPIALVMVRRKAARAASLPALVEALADAIPDPAGRAEFLRAAA